MARHTHPPLLIFHVLQKINEKLNKLGEQSDGVFTN